MDDRDNSPNAWLWDPELHCWLPHRLPVNRFGLIECYPAKAGEFWSYGANDPDISPISTSQSYRATWAYLNRNHSWRRDSDA